MYIARPVRNSSLYTIDPACRFEQKSATNFGSENAFEMV